MDPDDPGAHDNLAVALAESGKIDESDCRESDITRAEFRHCSYAPASWHGACRKQEMCDEAFEHFAGAVRTESRQCPAQNQPRKRTVTQEPATNQALTHLRRKQAGEPEEAQAGATKAPRHKSGIPTKNGRTPRCTGRLNSSPPAWLLPTTRNDGKFGVTSREARTAASHAQLAVRTGHQGGNRCLFYSGFFIQASPSETSSHCLEFTATGLCGNVYGVFESKLHPKTLSKTFTTLKISSQRNDNKALARTRVEAGDFAKKIVFSS